MKKQFIPILLLFVFFLTAAGYGLLRTIGTPTGPEPVTDPEPAETALVGNDRDEYGCIGSAGYSWCGPKQQCIRIWEQDCLSQEKIKEALMLKDGISSDTIVTVTHEDAQYARGTITDPSGNAGAMFLATKINDVWSIVYSGNGSVDCDAIRANYQFPQDMLAGFCD